MTRQQFLRLAQRRLADLGAVSPLRELRFPDQLRTDGQLEVVAAAIALISQLYVNLFLKREIHATDPEQSLHNLLSELSDIKRGRLQDLSDEEFHDRMTAIFVALRDRHTVYELPDPYRRTIAFLPFVVEHSDDPEGYFVTKVLGNHGSGFKTPATVDDAPRVTHWNGMPIEHAVRLNGDRNAGANRAARVARGLDRLTFRWMGTTTGPHEAWVDVGYVVGGTSHTKRFEWYAVQTSDAHLGQGDSDGTGLGRDGEGEWIRRVKTMLYAPPGAVAGVGGGLFNYREYTVDGDRYGYLRVYSFDMEPQAENDFIKAIGRRVGRAPKGGVVIDVRGNPGGQITAAERMIGLFAPVPVQIPQLFFRNTPQATTLAECLYESGNRVDSYVLEARGTGAPFIASLDLMPGALVETQRCQGPVLVVFDALTYSAAEVFTAGMLDQRLADVRGTAAQTGGGGANVWSYDALASMLNDPAPVAPVLAPLPYGASFTVAIRRITRVGQRNGVALEDLGVVVQDIDRLAVTLRDLLGSNRDLIRSAARELSRSPRYTLSADRDGNGSWMIRASDLEHVVVLVDDTIIFGLPDPDGHAFTLTDAGVGARRLTLQGFARGTVVTSAGYDL